MSDDFAARRLRERMAEKEAQRWKSGALPEVETPALDVSALTEEQKAALAKELFNGEIERGSA